MKRTIKQNKIAILIALIGLGTVFSSFIATNDREIDIDNDVQGFVHRKMENTAFKNGEELYYRVHYGIINAAKVSIKIDSDFTKYKDEETHHVVVYGRTLSGFDWMFKVRDRFDSYVNKETIAPMKYTKVVRENKYKDTDYAVFLPEIQKIYSSKAKGNIDTKKGYTYDIASALLYARNLDFSNAKVGDVYPINIYLDKEIHELSIKYAGTETIKSDIGKVECIKLIPKLVVDRVFNDEEAMTIWVSNDANKIPIRVKADIAVGSVKVDLTSYKGLKNEFTSKK